MRKSLLIGIGNHLLWTCKKQIIFLNYVFSEDFSLTLKLFLPVHKFLARFGIVIIIIIFCIFKYILLYFLIY